MKHGLLAIAGLAAAALLSCCSAALAEPAAHACAERSQVVARLAERYGETLQSIGLKTTSSVLEIYASDATGTWTILLTRPDGTACLIASGHAWETRAQTLPPEGDDA